MKRVEVRMRIPYSGYDHDDGEGQTVETFATNNNGEGLFIWQDGSYSQVRGNGQFHAKDTHHFMRQLRVIYEDQIVGMVRGSAWGWK